MPRVVDYLYTLMKGMQDQFALWFMGRVGSGMNLSLTVYGDWPLKLTV